MSEITSVPINKLIAPQNDHRFSTDFAKDQELVNSIKNLGIIEPLIVSKSNNKFEIVIGHRRYKAAIQAGLTSCDCIVVKGKEEDLEMLKLHENLHRLPLSHVEQGTTFEYMLEKFNLTEDKISILVGKSPAYVSQHLSLIKSDPVLIKDVHEGRITFSVARELLRCDSPEDLTYLREWSAKDGTSVEIVKSWVDEANRKRAAEPIQETERIPPSIPSQPVLPVFLCQACEQTHPIRVLTVARLCPDCNHLIFSAIQEEKEKALHNLETKPPHVPS